MLFLLMLASSSSARVWYVMPDSTGQVINIQTGIDSCGSGDTVLVAPGIYKGDGNRDLDFKGKPIVVISERRYNPAISDSSFIDCEGSYETTHRGFHFHSGETNASVLEGLVMMNGSASYEVGGGGILCDSASCPTLRHNTIRNCYTAGYGGGICCRSSSPLIAHNDLHANDSRTGGCGIYCIASSALITNNKIHRGYDSYWPEGISGVGIYCVHSSATIDSNDIYDNGVAYGPGAGICCSSCSLVTISNNDIHSNYAGDHVGGGIALYGSSASIYGNSIHHNHSGLMNGLGGGMYASGSILKISNNEFYGNMGGAGSAIYCTGSGVTLLNNNIHNDSAYDSGAWCVVFLDNSLSSLIRNNTIENNETGGIWYEGHSGTVISNNSIRGNRKYGIACSSSIAITNNTIMSNEFGGGPGYGGGGIRCMGSSPSIQTNLIVSNRSGSGGGISCESSSPIISGNTIVSNVSWEGGAVFVDSSSHPLLLNNIIANNQGSGGIYTETDTLTIMCCDVYNNEGGNYVGIPDQTGMNNNISADPLFCPEGYPEYTLHSNSPCAPYMNHDCGLIGANPVTCAQTGSDEFNKLISAYKLSQNYPNPFNPGTRIVFDLKEPSPVSLKVYDVNGGLVRTLVAEKRERGRHEIAWDGKDDSNREVASGVYFYRLTAGSFSETKKMVVLK
jgi:parallel beta-helix repeat protein